MSTVSWNEGKSRFGPSSFLRKIVGVSYLCKFYFEINSKTGTNIEDLFDNSGTQTNAPSAEKISLRDPFFYSQGITIPSRGITTDTYSYSNGFKIEIPNGSNYGDGNINIPIMVDKRYTFYDFFVSWMNLVHSKETGFFSFHDTYLANITIKQLDYTAIGDVAESTEKFHQNMSSLNSSNFSYGVELINCYPKAVSAIEFRHDAKDRVEFNVNMSYEGLNYITS